MASARRSSAAATVGVEQPMPGPSPAEYAVPRWSGVASSQRRPRGESGMRAGFNTAAVRSLGASGSPKARAEPSRAEAAAQHAALDYLSSGECGPVGTTLHRQAVLQLLRQETSVSPGY